MPPTGRPAVQTRRDVDEFWSRRGRHGDGSTQRTRRWLSLIPSNPSIDALDGMQRPEDDASRRAT
eukprot:5868856-Prymnesium_polylepis.1